MAEYGKIPSGATLKPKPFIININEKKLQDMKELLKLSPIGPAVYENTANNQGETKLSRPDRVFGMRRDWLSDAKDHWLDGFDWRKREERLNSFPHFKVEVTGNDGVVIDVHFMALFSEKPDAIPIAFYHGWPGSFLEFTKMLDLLRSKYSARDLPYHAIVPSLPGYAFSSGPPLDQDYSIEQAAEVLHNLMCGLGFENGYLSQGGDIGSGICFIQAARFDECKSMHVNMCMIDPELAKTASEMDELEAKAVPRGAAFMSNGMAYAMEHGTRPATIGLALSASPLAMLSWIGEKFLEWSDEEPALDDILESISLYWLTDTFPRSIYPYRAFVSRTRRQRSYIDKPAGYSFFPKELLPVPKAQAVKQINLVAFYQHHSGGHFAAMEKPAELLADVEDWVKKVWKA